MLAVGRGGWLNWLRTEDRHRLDMVAGEAARHEALKGIVPADLDRSAAFGAFGHSRTAARFWGKRACVDCSSREDRPLEREPAGSGYSDPSCFQPDPEATEESRSGLR